MDWLGWVTNGWRPGSLAWRLRQARWRVFLRLVADLPRPVRVLDLGGAEPFWAALRNSPLGLRSSEEWKVTMVNLYPQETSLPFVRAGTGSALDLSGFDAADYDVIFSNSVIEHLGSWEKQMQMGREIRRFGLRYYVQTPNRYFPIEPHFLLPFFQFIPRRARIWLACRWRWGSYCRPGDRLAAAEAVDEIRLLTAQEMRTLFPDAQLRREWLGPLVKSFMVVGRSTS